MNTRWRRIVKHTETERVYFTCLHHRKMTIDDQEYISACLGMELLKILDACCGSRMFWWDKQNPEVTFMDKRRYYEKLKTGHIVNVDPDIQGDFTNMPFNDESFDLVVFDPPHLIHAGKSSWLAKKYGTLDKSTWPTVVHDGFDECNRVVKPNGVIVFKWNEEQIPFSKVLKVIGRNPLFGDKRGKTRWVVFKKASEE